MATSLNGWPVITPKTATAKLSTGTVPGTKAKVRLDHTFLPLALAVLADIDKKLIKVDQGYGPDGWEYREARLGGGWSNHSSGTAVDFRYDVLKADRKKHLTDAQHDVMHAILDKYSLPDGTRVLQWGGDWKVGTAMDEMHIEVAQPWGPKVGRKITRKDILAVRENLGIRADGTFGPAVGKKAIVTSGTNVRTDPSILSRSKAKRYKGYSFVVAATSKDGKWLQTPGGGWVLKSKTDWK